MKRRAVALHYLHTWFPLDRIVSVTQYHLQGYC